MKRGFKIALWAVGSVMMVGLIASSVTGTGAFRRAVTLSWIYSICRPDGYDVVCFLDADGHDGGMFCLPLSSIGNKCKGIIQ